MKIEDISIFGEYKQAENRVTAAFLQICKIGGEDFIRFMTNQLKIQLQFNRTVTLKDTWAKIAAK